MFNRTRSGYVHILARPPPVGKVRKQPNRRPRPRVLDATGTAGPAVPRFRSTINPPTNHHARRWAFRSSLLPTFKPRGRFIFRRYRTDPRTGVIHDAHDHGLKAWRMWVPL